MKRCPFSWKACKQDCVLYRRGLRYYELPDAHGRQLKPEPFEECAFNVAVDCLENMIGRSIGMQKAQEQTRNETAALKELFFRAAVTKQLETTVAERAQQIEDKRRIQEVIEKDVIEVDS